MYEATFDYLNANSITAFTPTDLQA